MSSAGPALNAESWLSYIRDRLAQKAAGEKKGRESGRERAEEGDGAGALVGVEAEESNCAQGKRSHRRQPCSRPSKGALQHIRTTYTHTILRVTSQIQHPKKSPEKTQTGTPAATNKTGRILTARAVRPARAGAPVPTAP